MPAIRRIHWGRVGTRRHHGEPGILYAIWPEPVDHDECFMEAGFERFDDSDEEWDLDFENLLERVAGGLRRHGTPRFTGEPPVGRQSLLDRLLLRRPPRIGLHEHLALVARDDQFDPGCIDFGDPVRAAVVASDGHPVLWIWLHAVGENAWVDDLEEVAGGRPIVETTLRWDRLLPRAGPCVSEP